MPMSRQFRGGRRGGQISSGAKWDFGTVWHREIRKRDEKRMRGGQIKPGSVGPRGIIEATGIEAMVSSARSPAIPYVVAILIVATALLLTRPIWGWGAPAAT